PNDGIKAVDQVPVALFRSCRCCLDHSFSGLAFLLFSGQILCFSTGGLQRLGQPTNQCAFQQEKNNFQIVIQAATWSKRIMGIAEKVIGCKGRKQGSEQTGPPSPIPGTDHDGCEEQQEGRLETPPEREQVLEKHYHSDYSDSDAVAKQ